MLGLPLAFAVPAVLASLALLPALWWLLRLTPPRPREIPFPPLRLILDLSPREETPAHTPWWLMLLRLALAGAIILAMSGPVWNPPPIDGGKGPLMILLDDGWPAAPDWDARLDFVSRRIEAAERAARPVVLAPLSDGDRQLEPIDPADAIDRVRALRPQPWIPDRMQALGAVRAYLSAHRDAEILWIADGLEQGRARPFAEALAAAAPGRVSVFTEDRTPAALAGAENGTSGLDVQIERADGRGQESGVVRALDRRGLEIGRAPFAFGSADVAKARFNLPVELRNEVSLVEIFGERSAGAVTLLDSRSRRRRVGVVSGDSADLAVPYVAPDYFIDKALSPFADLRDARPGEVDPISDIIDEQPAAIILTDVGRIAGPTHDKLAAWVANGGTLIRFAGTRLAQSVDDLVPVRLREGGRVLGGALSWDTPRKLAPFERSSPFWGLAPPPEVTIRRQVLAEPDADLPGKIWASLEDGTPLVTAERRGKGLIVLFHVTADTSWSNLPLSGLFVDMLRRVVDLSVQPGGAAARGGAAAAVESARQTAQEAIQNYAPTSALDGFGVLGPPPPTARPIPANFTGTATRDHPPGFYGPADAALAVNPLAPTDRLRRADLRGLDLRTARLASSQATDLRPPLIVIAFLLLALDGLASLWLAGAFGRRLRGSLAAAAVLGTLAASAGCFAPRPALAQDQGLNVPQRDVDAALETRLAYVVTGDPSVDAESQAGLASLSEALAARTSFTPGPPVGVDPARDELVFYPMLYWPIAADRPQPSAQAVAKIAAYMKDGGTIVFDTRDALESRPDGPATPETQWLRTLLAGVDVPELEPVPRDHVITKTFYLLDGFVGRTTIGQTWIQALPPPNPNDPTPRPARAGDGVSPIIITSNDLAAAWAAGPDGEPMYPLVPGGARQRELAIRGGINIVMYTLTGNYKADQVHVRDLLERLAH
jgi:Domain of unknown function (DUF4159)/Aerotolerance regulator N-terminal